MYDNKFRKAMYEYAVKYDKSINSLTDEDYDKILNEFADKSFVDECIMLERKEVLNPMFKKAKETLFKAYQADTQGEAKEMAKLAYRTSQECLDALNMWYNLEEDHNEKLVILDEGVQYEEDKLKRLGYFEKKYIGKFYDEIETRNYLRILRNKLDVLLFVGRIGIAKELCLEMLRLNKNDDLGVSYILLAIYAYQEDKEHLIKLKEKLNEDSVETLMPLAILYYKLNQMDKVKECLSKINEISSDFMPFFRRYLGDFRGEDSSQSEISENMLSIMNNFNFLINTTTGFLFYLGTLDD